MQLPQVFSNDRSHVFEFSTRERQYGIPLKRAVTTGLVGVVTDRAMAGFVPWKHL